MASDLTESQKREYDRWQGYANALLLALTVLFAGSTFAIQSATAPIIIASFALGLAGIVSNVLWFAMEYEWKWGNKPLLLRLASIFFGGQVGFLFVALLVFQVNKS